MVNFKQVAADDFYVSLRFQRDFNKAYINPYVCSAEMSRLSLMPKVNGKV